MGTKYQCFSHKMENGIKLVITNLEKTNFRINSNFVNTALIKTIFVFGDSKNFHMKKVFTFLQHMKSTNESKI